MQVQHVCVIATLSFGCVGATASPDVPPAAEVLTVEPLVEPVFTHEPHRRCWKLRNTDSTASDGYLRHCVDVWSASARHEMTGYRVEYRHRGRVGRIRADRHPGDFIRIRHAWEAIHF